MKAIDNLTAAVSELTVTVQQAIAAGIGGNADLETQIQAQADAVSAANNSLKAAIPVPPTI